MTRRPALLIVLALLAGLIGFAPAKAGLPIRTPCDLRDKAHCLLPFPNDHFTRPAIPGVDRSGTGKMVDFSLAEMPRSIAGKPIDPTELNRQDGFSPGSTVLAFVPGLDLHRTWGTHDDFAGDPRLGGPVDPRDHISKIDRFEADDAPILIINADTGERWPFWSELDMNAATKSNERVLILRPARNFLEGTRYLVALRNMRRSDGTIIKPSSLFKIVIDARAAGLGARAGLEVGPQAAHIGDVVDEIEAAEAGRGFDRNELFLAWDFTVASEQNLSERVLHIRDTALAQLGDTSPGDSVVQGSAPAFTVTKTTELPDANKQRLVEGTISVPNFLDRPPYPVMERDPAGLGVPMQAIGGRFLYGPDGLPMQNPAFPTVDIPFSCTIPRIATPETPAHPLIYGHGLLGSRGEANGGSNDRNRERNFMPCAINWMGFAEYDVANAVLTLADPSNMPHMIDRAQQGFLNWIILQRAIVHEDGFASHPAFQSGGQPLMQMGKLVYDGNSQGGIMGGALCALSVDLTRCVLGVPGMNYSTLLNRSVDWEGPLVNPSIDPMNPSDDPEDYLPSYSSLLYTMYPNKIEQQVVMALMQMLWDRGEGNGYAQHMTSDPLPNTPPHQVLMHVAYGDYQVAVASAEVEARTIGARIMQTSLTVPMVGGAPRHWALDPFYGMDTFDVSGGAIQPWNGSALVYWDSGNRPPPNANVPPALDGSDPHEHPRRTVKAGDQKATFWLTGLITDVMNGGPYLACPLDRKQQVPAVPSLFAIPDWCV